MANPLEKTTVPGIYKRGNRYVIIYRLHGRQKWESHRTFEDARRAKRARLVDIDRGEFQEQSRVTLHEYAKQWIDTYQGRGRRGFREETREDYRRQLNTYVFKYFSDRMRMTELTPEHVAGFIAWLCDENQQGRELADATVRNIMAALRSCLATAVRRGVIRTNPAREIDLPHRPVIQEDDDDTVKVLTTEQLATFLRVVHPRYRLFFRLLAETGLRISEGIALQWKDLRLDGSAPCVRVRRRIVKGKQGPPKSKYGRREVPIAFSLVSALREHRSQSEWNRDDDPVFASRNGTPIVPGNVFYRHLKPAAEEAGVPWMGYHALRHTAASRLFARGANAVQVQHWLGHHSASFTLARYVHLLDGDLGAPLDLDAELAKTNGRAIDAASILQADHATSDDIAV